MPYVTRHAKLLLCVASVLFAGSNARAATVVWTIDTAATTMGLAATGAAPLGAANAALKIINQGIIPFPGTVTPTVLAKIQGQIVTDTDFSTTITFLKQGRIDGVTTGNFSPDITGVAGTSAPGDIGTSILAKVVPVSKIVADGVLRDLAYDISGKAAITGGSFPTSTLSVAIVRGRLDYRGFDLGADLGSGTTNITDQLPGDANLDRIVDGADYTVWADNFLKPGPNGNWTGDFNGDNLVDGADYTSWADDFLKTDDPFPAAFNAGGNAKITIVGNKATLTIPLFSTVGQNLDEGDDTNSTTDDIIIDLKFLGNIVATATIPAGSQPIPEPSTMALAIVAGLSCCAVGIQRKLRRKA